LQSSNLLTSFPGNNPEEKEKLILEDESPPSSEKLKGMIALGISENAPFGSNVTSKQDKELIKLFGSEYRLQQVEFPL